MVDACLYELLLLIFRFVKAYNARDVKVFKHLEVVFWRVSSSITACWINGSHEGDKLVGNNEIQISIFNFLIVFILFIVEFSEVIPAVADSNLKALQALVDGAAVGTVAIGGISEGPELLLIWSKRFPRYICWLPQNDNHKRTH